jgi:hypothetical protein
VNNAELLCIGFFCQVKADAIIADQSGDLIEVSDAPYLRLEVGASRAKGLEQSPSCAIRRPFLGMRQLSRSKPNRYLVNVLKHDRMGLHIASRLLQKAIKCERTRRALP